MLTQIVHRSEYVSAAIGLGASEHRYGSRIQDGERHVNVFLPQINSHPNLKYLLPFVRSRELRLLPGISRD